MYLRYLVKMKIQTSHFILL